MNQLEPIWS
jgi:hypothetical protein